MIRGRLTRDGFTEDEWRWLGMFADGMSPHAIAVVIAERSATTPAEAGRLVRDTIRRALTPSSTALAS